MTGKKSGAVTRLQALCYETCSSKVFRTWCGLHQLDLVVKKAVKELIDENFIFTLTNISNILRRQINLSKTLGKCPRFIETRWTSMSKMLKWLIKNRIEVMNYLKHNKPKANPPSYFWILVYVLHAYMKPIKTSFTKLQALTTMVSEQEEEFKKLTEELQELCYIESVDSLEEGDVDFQTKGLL